MKRRTLCWVVCVALCAVACKKTEKSSAVPSANDILQKMNAREKVLSSFAIQVRTEDADMTVEHTLTFRAPNLLRADVTQPQKLVLSFDGQNYYRLEEATGRLSIVSLQLPTMERKMALSMLMGALIPEGFQLPRMVLRNSKQSWLEAQGQSRVLRMENPVSEGNESATIVYVVRWPSMDFLKKEIFVDGQEQVAFVMQEETCMPQGEVCLPTQIVAKHQEEALAPQKIKLLNFQQAVSNEHFVLQAPEGFSTERHTLSSLSELQAFVP